MLPSSLVNGFLATVLVILLITVGQSPTALPHPPRVSPPPTPSPAPTNTTTPAPTLPPWYIQAEYNPLNGQPCGWYGRISHSTHDILPVWLGNYRDVRVRTVDYETYLERVWRTDFQFLPWGSVESFDEGLQLSNWNNNLLVLMFTNNSYLREDGRMLGGYACRNFSFVSMLNWWNCPEVIVAHEIGHNLGHRHTGQGVMKDPGLSCEDGRLG